jgi:hypothetical protein
VEKQHRIRPWHGALVGSVAVAIALSLSGIGTAGTSGVQGAGARQQARTNYFKHQGGSPTATHTGNDGYLADQLAQYDFQRTALADVVSGQALVDTAKQAAALPRPTVAGCGGSPGRHGPIG